MYSWLGAAAVAPFVTILSLWTLVIFRSYRNEWRLVDLFLFALTSLEVASALFGFGYSVLSVIRPALDGPCRFVVWGLVATRTFHLSTVTSLLLDRALSSKWPYTYRTTVRQSQVRYHIVVLAIISVFVGVTAVFARLPSSAADTCSLHPLEWDFKFSIFLAAVYGLLLVTGFVCCLVVQGSRFRTQGSYRTAQGWDSGTNSSGTSSDKHPKEVDYTEARDLEWALVACVCWLSYMLNHGPFLVLTVMGMVVPTFWSPWLDNSVVWLRLAEGALVPLLLLVADLPHRSALRNMLRQPGRIYRHLADHGGFRMQIGDPNQETKSGFLPPLVMFPNSGGYQLQIPPFQLPQRLRWSPTTMPSLQALQTLPNGQPSLLKSNALDTDLSAQQVINDYGSSGYTLLSLKSSSSRLFSSPSFSTFSSGSSKQCSEDGESITTDAIDDFVYHGTRGRSPRPSVMTIFRSTPEPPPYERNDLPPRKDTPTPFINDIDYSNIDSSGYAPKKEGTCNCDCEIKPENNTLEKNMINIILTYANSPSRNRRQCTLSSTDCTDDAETVWATDERSSSESDADSIQSVIIRQLVDQQGRVSASAICRAQKKMLQDGKEESDTSDISQCESATESDSSRSQRIIYSEYL